MPPPKKSDPGYDAYREGQAKIAADRSAKGREIGPIPDIADVRRRSRCRKSLRKFCEVYNPAAFYLGWADYHLRAIERIEEAATLGALYAMAFPRGSGKTTLVRMAALWVIANAIRRYVFVIGANDAKADDTLNSLRMLIRFSPEFAADYPEISYPAQHLKGIGQRAGGQTCNDESTLIEWAGRRVVLATVPPPSNWPKSWHLRADGKVPTSGAVFGASGLTGEGIRGSLLTLSTGEMVRPDFVLIDDPQSSESAHSPTQNATREQLVGADVLGMAGPDRSIAAVMPCTVIAEGDFIDRILDREAHPLWRGERVGLLTALPANMEAWEDYFDVYRACAQLEPPDFTAANEHYTTHRAKLDEGTEATWPDRKQAWEVSAVQAAMHLYCRDRRAFWSEGMNRPQPADAAAGAKGYTPALVADRTNGHPRGVVPPGCTRLTAGIDVGGGLLWYAVVAWTEAFGGRVVDYGCLPRQGRAVFAATEARPSLKDVYPNHTDAQRVFAGLRDLLPAVVGKVYKTADGHELRVDRGLIDCGWEPTGVSQAIAASPLAGVLYASKGVGRSATQVGVARWKPRPGERTGYHWRLTLTTGGGRGRQVQFDPDAWKSFLHAQLTVPEGGAGGLTLFGDGPDLHELLSEHVAAEYSEPATLKGDTFDKWLMRPNRTDNHLLDCLVLAAVAASVHGLSFRADGSASRAPTQTKPPVPPPKPGERVRIKPTRTGV
jgi:hypothetical protein